MLRPRLRIFGKRQGWQVIRLDELDADDVARAYQEDQLTVSECAHRFATAEDLISLILDQKHIPVRDHHSAEDQQSPRPQPAPAAPLPVGERRWWGPIERQLQARHVTDLGLLLRAAALDRAGRELLAQVLPAERQSPAQLAAQDMPAEPGDEPNRGRTRPATPVAQSRQNRPSRPPTS
jgi:hypothetical protein